MELTSDIPKFLSDCVLKYALAPTSDIYKLLTDCVLKYVLGPTSDKHQLLSDCVLKYAGKYLFENNYPKKQFQESQIFASGMHTLLHFVIVITVHILTSIFTAICD